ncbi:MAG: mechanosensitive ion channel family protein [Phycisphaerae bacterium]
MQQPDAQNPTPELPTPQPAETVAPTTSPITPARDVGEGVGRLTQGAGEVVYALPTIAVGLMVLLSLWFVGFIVAWLLRRLVSKTRERRNLALAFGRLFQGICIVLGVLVAAVIVFPNFTPTRLLEFLGLGSVAVGFAFRDVLQNYLAGLLLLFTEPFRIGDQIVFREYEGTVTDIQTRATFVRTYDGRRAVIPNAELFINPVLVNTAFDRRRVEYDLGIGYGDDIAEARQIILAVLETDPTAHDDPPPDVLVYELAPDAVILRVRWWIEPPQRADALESRDSVLEKLKVRLTAAGIDLPFPTRQVLLHDQTEPEDGDRHTRREGWPTPRTNPEAEPEAEAAPAAKADAKADAEADAGEPPPHRPGA